MPGLPPWGFLHHPAFNSSICILWFSWIQSARMFSPANVCSGRIWGRSWQIRGRFPQCVVCWLQRWLSRSPSGPNFEWQRLQWKVHISRQRKMVVMLLYCYEMAALDKYLKQISFTLISQYELPNLWLMNATQCSEVIKKMRERSNSGSQWQLWK